MSDSRRLGVLILSYKVNKINGLRIFQMVKYRYLILSFAALGAVFFYAIFAAVVEEEANAASFSAMRAAR